VDPWTDEALNHVPNEDIPNAKRSGVGAGSKVAFPWMALPQTRVRTAEGETESRDTPREIALGHELIHADHAQRGVWRGDDKTLKHFATGEGERGDYAIAEEMDTVGLGDTKRAGDITENDLREQLGHEQRVSYHAPGMFDTLAARARQQQIEAREKFERMVREHNAWHKSMQAVWAQKRKDQ
jgi:NleD-like pathogen effector protein (putative zinc metallopeptidase)